MRLIVTEGHVRQLGGETWYRLIYVEGRQRLEHRVVMERVLGRLLRRNEVVHHKDENGLNNDPSNLQVMTFTEHRRIHGGPRKWKITLEGAISLRHEGMTLEEIGEVAGVSWSAVRKVFSLRGVPTKDARHGTTSWNLELATHRLKEKWSISAIAREAGVSGPSVRKAFVKHGLLR